MGFYSLPKPLENLPKPKPSVPFITEFEKYEAAYFKKNPVVTSPAEAKALQVLIKNATNPLFYLLIIIVRLMMRRKNKIRIDKTYSLLHSKGCSQKKYRKTTPDTKTVLAKIDRQPMTAGNIPYRNLVQAQGNDYRVRLDLSAVPKLYAYPFFFSARLYSNYALVTIKEKDKELLQQALEIEDISIIEKHNRHYTPVAEYNELKKRAAQLDVKVEFLVIQPEQFESLKDEKDRFVSIATKEGKIRLAFLPQNKDYILHALYPDKYKTKTDTLFSVGRNSKVNTRLKSEALLGGKEMRYRILSREQVEQLAESVGEDRFAVFSKNAQGENLNGQYNVVFKEDDTAEIESALQNPKTTKRKL